MIFKYQAYDDLLLELGRNDYVVEISELAIRDFLRQIKNSGKPADYIKSKCEEFGIMVSYDKANNYYNQTILGHIANVYHLAETFLYEMQVEYNSFADEPWKFDKNKTKLDQTITFFKTKNRFNQTDKIEPYLQDTFEYYHQLRVLFSHKKTTSPNEVANKWNKAKAHFENGDTLKTKYKIVSNPKDYQNLDFEDFFLFTQIAKELCLKISSYCYPEPKGLASMPELKILKKHADEEIRKKRIESFLKTKFGYIRENDTDILVEDIDKYL